MKHYRNLNGCVSKMHRVIYDAYDKGYEQARKDFEKPKGEWELSEIRNSYRCSICKNLSISKYLYCPHCGSYKGDEDYGKD